MLPALFDDERRTLLRAALMMCAASLAMLPLTSQSSLEAGAGTVTATSSSARGNELETLSFPSIALDRDPFVPGVAMPDAAMSAADSRENGGSGAVVRAVVTGTEPRALVEIGTVVRVVGIGDAVGTAKVLEINASGVTLSGGIKLFLTPEQK